MDDEEDEEEASALFQEMLNNISLEDSQSDDEDEAAALFQEMLNNISFEDDCDEIGFGSAGQDDFAPVDLPCRPAFLNIQLIGCKKMAVALEMVHKRRSLSRWSSHTEEKRQALQKAVAHHKNGASRKFLRHWEHETRQRVQRRKSALKSMESIRRRLVLHSALDSLILNRARSILIDCLRTMILWRQARAAMQVWHRRAKLRSVCSLLEAKVVSQSMSTWRGAVVQAKMKSQSLASSSPFVPHSGGVIEESPPSPPPPPPPPLTASPTDDDEGSVSYHSTSVATIPPATSSNEGKENIPDSQRNIRKSKVSATKRRPKLLIDMEQRQAARTQRRQEARERKERELIAKREAEEKARADQEKRRQLLIEQRRLSTEMASLYQTVSLMKRHFHQWKDVSVVKNEWDTRKAYVLWSDTVLNRGFSGWRAATASAQKERAKQADLNYLRRPFAAWREQTRHVKTNLGRRVVEISTHHRKKRALEQWLAKHYEKSKEVPRLERIAMKRARASTLRSAIARWRDASAIQRTEREIDERVQEQKREISMWLDGAL